MPPLVPSASFCLRGGCRELPSCQATFQQALDTRRLTKGPAPQPSPGGLGLPHGQRSCAGLWCTSVSMESSPLCTCQCPFCPLRDGNSKACISGAPCDINFFFQIKRKRYLMCNVKLIESVVGCQGEVLWAWGWRRTEEDRSHLQEAAAVTSRTARCGGRGRRTWICGVLDRVRSNCFAGGHISCSNTSQY